MRLLWILALSLLLGCGGAGAPPPSAQSPMLDRDLPAFKRRTVNGPEVNTASAGKVVVVKFFAKYCEPCKKTLPTAQALHQNKPEVLFIGIAEDEYQEDVQEMIDTFRLSFPVVHDRGNVLAGRFRVQELPITFVADPNGRVRWVGDGKSDESALEAAIEWVKHPATP